MTTFQVPEHWTFKNEHVADHFDQHVRKQLPFYELATQAVADLARLYLPRDGHVVDLGASNGNIARALDRLLLERQATIVSLEESEQMCERFVGPGTIICADLLDFEPEPEHADVVISFLTLAFLPPAERGDILDGWRQAIRPGGALIVVERVHVTPASQARYLIQAAKLRNGEDEDDVLAKEFSIGGVLRPIPQKLFASRGAWPFFAYGDFHGYVIESPEVEET